MMIAADTKLGPYEVFAPLGAGGMGEVYRAQDTKLAREVPVKILPDQVRVSPKCTAREYLSAAIASTVIAPVGPEEPVSIWPSPDRLWRLTAERLS